MSAGTVNKELVFYITQSSNVLVGNERAEEREKERGATGVPSAVSLSVSMCVWERRR